MPNINDTFRYSMVDNLLGLIDLNDIGADMEWNYSTLGSFSQRLDTFVDPVFGTPLIYNVTFSNIFDMNHFATIASRNRFGQFPQSFIAVENVYDFYRETNDFFANVGLGLTINGYPLTSVMEPRDMIWEFPLEYGDEDHSFAQFGVQVPQFGYYGQKISRTNTVDGWGQLTTRYGTFNTLRVTTTLDIIDTISVQGFGFEQNQPTTFEVKWLAKNVGTALLTVKGQIVFGQQVINSVEYLDSIRGFTQSSLPPDPVDTTTTDTTSAGILNQLNPEDITVIPNPFKDQFSVHFNLPQDMMVSMQLFDNLGRMVADLGKRTIVAQSGIWNQSLQSMSLPSGIYHLLVTGDEGSFKMVKIVKEF